MNRLLPRKEVEALTGLSRTTIYRKMREGTFPLPIKISERAVRWKEVEIVRFINDRPRAVGEVA